MVLFFLSGMLGYHFKVISSYEYEFSEIYLANDQLLGEIIEFQKGENEFDKAIIEVKKVIKPHTEALAQGKLLCYIRTSNSDLKEGSVILFQPDIQPIKNKNNPGEFNAEQYWKIKGISTIAFTTDENIEVLGQAKTFNSFWTNSRNYLANIVEQYIDEENQGLVIALSLGDKSNLSMEKRDHFANAGAMHVLAVSGMHVGILLWFIELIFKSFKFLRKRNLYIYFALISLWCFAFLTGMSASVVRAVMMFSIMGFGQLMGKKFFGLQAIFASALLLLIFNPLILFDIGFQLSYLAVIGISLFYRPIVNVFHSSYKRSEEHTSELQSRPHLVCRLLLEKKKPSSTSSLTISRAGRCSSAVSRSASSPARSPSTNLRFSRCHSGSAAGSAERLALISAEFT